MTINKQREINLFCLLIFMIVDQFDLAIFKKYTVFFIIIQLIIHVIVGFTIIHIFLHLSSHLSYFGKVRSYKLRYKLGRRNVTESAVGANQ